MAFGAYGNPDPFTAALMAEAGQGRGLDTGLLRGMAINRAGQTQSMLEDANQTMQMAAQGGATPQAAMLEAFKQHPLLMVEHPEIFQSLGHLRQAMQPREVAPNSSLMTDQGQLVGTAPGGATPSSIQFHEGQGDAPDYFTETEPNGAQRVVQSNGKFTVHQTTDGRVLRVNQKNGEVQDMGNQGGDAFTRELDQYTNELTQSLIQGGMDPKQAQQQAMASRLKMRQDRIGKLSTQPNPYAVFGLPTPGSSGGAPAVPGTPPATPGAGPTAPIYARDSTGKRVSSTDGQNFRYDDGTPYTPPAPPQ